MHSTLANVSIDLDGIACYHAIHGLPTPRGQDPVYSVGLQRFLELMDELSVPATLFTVGRDVALSDAADVLHTAVVAGHEIANHSFSHNYRLVHCQAAEIEAEIGRAHDSIFRRLGVEPCGFRAPGYNMSEAVLDVLEARGYRYDASIFPAPLYFSLRAAAITYYQLRGQASRSLVGDPRQFLASRRPYKPRRGAMHHAGNAGTARTLLEIPVATLPALRLPYIGTTLALLPRTGVKALTRYLLLSKAPICLELHGVDFLDASDAGVSAELVARQKDLRVSARRKIERLRVAIKGLKQVCRMLRLDEMALRLS
jgi:hypothetical protein